MTQTIVDYEVHMQPLNAVVLSKHLILRICRYFVSRIMLHLKVTVFNYNRHIMTVCSNHKNRLLLLINLIEDLMRTSSEISNIVIEIREVKILVLDAEKQVNETFSTDFMLDSLKTVPILCLMGLLKDTLTGSFKYFQRMELSSVSEMQLVDKYVSEVENIFNYIYGSILALPNMKSFPTDFSQITTNRFRIHEVWTE